MEDYDFSGWATRNDLLCGDGRTIRKNAFKDNDGDTVPVIWNHDHVNQDAVLGHALLENRDEGVYAYVKLNDTEQGQMAKKLVQHGDVRSLSIYANKLKQIGNDVIHGSIRELSLVLAGANPGASIDFVMAHGEDEEDSLLANYDENALVIYHADPRLAPMQESEKEKEIVADEKEKTVAEVFNTLTEEQKKVVYYMLGQAIEGADVNEEEEDDTDMKHNVFDQEEQQKNTLSHSDMEAIISDAKRYGSMKESFLAHTSGDATYGIKNADDWLFPEARNLNTPPEFIKRDTGWVEKVMNGTHHSPFSRIKSMFADITEDEARAKGYIKGKLKKEEVFSLLKRTTSPTTIYKKQKMDRDDVTDITDFDVIAWLKSEMRMMLDEEIARAILVGDGRLNSSDDKINEQHIRPIWTDEDLYTVKATVEVASGATADQKTKAAIRSIIKSRKNYKGSGEPSLFTTEDFITDCLLLEDNNGRVIYDTMEKLKNAFRVKDIITVPVMEGLTREVESKTHELLALIVNLKDYNVGADKGGSVSMFEDFDIDYNQQKYLIETRCSGALIKPYSAIAVELVTTTAPGA